MNLRYALSEIAKHGTDRTWWRRRFLTHVVSRYHEWNPPEATPLVDEDWDNALVLDACRYDLFAAALDDHPLPGTLGRRRSVDSCTPGFLRKNFDDETFHDVVYVNANPYVRIHLDVDQFHAVDSVWEDAWDDDLNTVRPETMRDRAQAANEKYPDKRLLVHFLQPHFPFIGETQLPGQRDFTVRDQALGDDDAVRRAPSPFEALEVGTYTRDEVWAAYRSNLDVALPAVESLLETLPGKTAVTADHGNALGERAHPFPIRVYGHPLGVPIPALTEVPWHTVQNGERKDVVAEPPERDDDDVSEDTQERLRMLGYAE